MSVRQRSKEVHKRSLGIEALQQAQKEAEMSSDRGKSVTEMLIQFTCEWCSQPITDAEPGRIEFFSEKRDGRRVAPTFGVFDVKLRACHKACLPRIHGSFIIALPRQLRLLGDIEGWTERVGEVLGLTDDSVSSPFWWWLSGVTWGPAVEDAANVAITKEAKR